MVHIVIGALAIFWGMWRILRDWWFFAEILKILIFVGLIVFGIVAVLAGLRRFRINM